MPKISVDPTKVGRKLRTTTTTQKGFCLDTKRKDPLIPMTEEQTTILQRVKEVEVLLGYLYFFVSSMSYSKSKPM